MWTAAKAPFDPAAGLALRQPVHRASLPPTLDADGFLLRLKNTVGCHAQPRESAARSAT